MTTTDDYEGENPMHWKRTILFLLGIAVTITGCGGGSSSTSTNAPSPFSDTYLKVSLTTGVYSPSSLRSASVSISDGSGLASLTGEPADVIIFRRLANGSYLATTEITRYQWSLMMGTTPWHSVSATIQGSTTDSQLPANNLSQADAMAFAAVVATKCTLGATLPVVADFQDAFGGPGHDYPSPSAPSIAAVATLRESGTTGPTASGAHAAMNGFYDIIGNVREWTADDYLVGGGWLDNASVAGISKAMLSVDPDIRHPLAGFRLIIRP